MPRLQRPTSRALLVLTRNASFVVAVVVLLKPPPRKGRLRFESLLTGKQTRTALDQGLAAIGHLHKRGRCGQPPPGGIAASFRKPRKFGPPTGAKS